MLLTKPEVASYISGGQSIYCHPEFRYAAFERGRTELKYETVYNSSPPDTCIISPVMNFDRSKNTMASQTSDG